jgi:hypothetical protein
VEEQTTFERHRPCAQTRSETSGTTARTRMISPG